MTCFFFDTFGVGGLKSFIIQDGQKLIEKILFRIGQLTRADKKITLVNKKFSLNACKNLSKYEPDNLSNTARYFFYFVQSFENKLKLRDFVNLWMEEDQIQYLDTVNCSIFQNYFYGNLFNPDLNSKIQNRKKTKQKKRWNSCLMDCLFSMTRKETKQQSTITPTNVTS